MTGRWTLPPLSPGEFVPMFIAPTRANPKFKFDTVAGRYVLLAFMPRDAGRRERACAAFEAVRGAFDDITRAAIFLTRDGLDAAAEDRLPGQRWMFDPDGAVGARFPLGDDDGGWFLVDPALRLIASAPLDAPEALFEQVRRLPDVDGNAETPLVAPALIVPRVFTPDLCRRLIAHYEAEGGAPSGVMRDIDGKTVGVLDGMKSRRDVTIADEGLRREATSSIERNLIPMMRRGLQFQATRIERTIIACYDANEGGYFRPHRDNTTLGTAHRRFAASINLNAEDFDGGDLRFPEFGRRTYRPPTGGAVVFSCSMQHEATPVTRGRRYAFLPFFYDEAGNEIRERNRALIDNGAMENQTG
ncbi:MAG: peroxiredoxin [Phenylobacterium zucineum]|nr:MAG: peroxiredoxin [Phenylobacterium zucineum]